MRRSFTSSSRILAAVLLPLALLALWDRLLVARPHQAGGSDEMMVAYRAAQPDIVLLGNSITRTAFDEQLIQARLESAGIHQKLFKYHESATGPPIWYLALKNVILAGPHRPRVLILAARSYMFTDTTYGMSGNYLKQYLPLYEGTQDPLVARKTFSSRQEAFSYDRLLYEHSNLYYNRDVYQRAVRRLFLNLTCDAGDFVSAITGATAAEHRLSTLRASFDEKEGLAGALRRAYNNPSTQVAYFDVPKEDQGTADTQRKRAGLTGDALINSSYLPDILALCRQNGVRLIIVRNYPYAPSESTRSTSDAEWQVVRDYLARTAPDVATIDMGQCAGITVNDFYAGQHYTEAGQAILSEYLAQQLIPLLR